ncbi:MAG: helix-hairpin-helix domain-containing protein [Deltaproteobacteria bacterium]|nr:helix-hairpin-helix domain-containing protein [Deltaproteobacteria bacterium]
MLEITPRQKVLIAFLVLIVAYGTHPYRVNQAKDEPAVPVQPYSGRENARSYRMEMTAVQKFLFFIPINVNQATRADLTLIPGIGRKTAEKITGYRKTYGKFSQVDDILQVKGIGQKKLNMIRPYITTE